MQVLPGVASGTFMPELVKVTDEGPGWKPELSGQESRGGAARVRAASSGALHCPQVTWTERHLSVLVVYLSEVYIIHV